MKQTLIELKGEIDSSIIIVGDFNTQRSVMDEQPDRRSIRKQHYIPPGPN